MAYNVDYITGGLKQAYESFYDKIDLINNIISTSPDNTPFWNIVTTVSDAVIATAISLACIYALIGFIKDGVDFRGNWEGFIRCLIRLIITKGLIVNSTEIMLAIYNIGAEVCSKIHCNLNMETTTISIADNPDGLIATLFSYVKYLPFQFLLWICGVIILVITLGMLLQICIFIMFAPISFAQFASGGFDGIKNFLKDYFSVCLQGSIIMGSISLFSVFLAHKNIFGAFTDSYLGDIGLTLIYCIVLIKVLMSSQNWSRKFLS
ncbi:UNVERIFIED_ORG: hypothetical protein B2H98_08135 [Clostridium botulinum]|uniref:hypothetical protein n=1 Tax=Clostridium sp. VAP23 TaxID=2949981 RepID=UPI000A16DFC5|nr:hypothetical protein [Clostridium sp. VAP23]